MDRQADESRDIFDWMRLPRLPRYLDMSFHHPEYFYPEFSWDVVPTTDHYVWEFTLGSNLKDPRVRLNWDNSYFGSGDKQLILFDVEHQRAVNMRELDTYVSVSDKGNRPFRVYYGSQAFLDSTLTPDRVFVGLPYPNPARSEVRIPVAVPAAANPYHVRLQIFNSLGQLVVNADEGSFPTGFYELSWDGNNAQGETSSAGVYIYKVLISGNGVQTYESGRVVKE